MSEKLSETRTRFDGDYHGVATQISNSECDVVILAPSPAALEQFLLKELPRTDWKPDCFKKVFLQKD